jgi:ATP-binding cassette subfamily B multidrug efflux pump
VKRLARFLKPYLLLILLAIVLLYVQANAELALPDYMSRIVNTGIQQNGIENAVPKAVRQTQMDRLTLLMSAEDRATVLDSYTLVEPLSPEALNIVQDYPVLNSVAVYVLKDVAAARITSPDFPRASTSTPCWLGCPRRSAWGSAPPSTRALPVWAIAW